MFKASAGFLAHGRAICGVFDVLVSGQLHLNVPVFAGLREDIQVIRHVMVPGRLRPGMENLHDVWMGCNALLKLLGAVLFSKFYKKSLTGLG